MAEPGVLEQQKSGQGSCSGEEEVNEKHTNCVSEDHKNSKKHKLDSEDYEKSSKSAKLDTEPEEASETQSGTDGFPEDQTKRGGEFASMVAKHYNEVEELGVDMRNRSKILHLRNFNNWVKCVLINHYSRELGKVKNVLDLCCGKGGDLLKWLKQNIDHLICADIACVSIQQCESRYKLVKESNENVFSCEFITADCTRVSLREKFQNPNIELDIVSCQFSFHYCFESLPQAECMLKNVSECLRPGGYFIGTIPNANEIVRRLKKSNSKVIKNSVFSIEMQADEQYPLFGAKYDFSLDSVVNCPEFLVHFPTLIKLAEKFGLVFEYKESFADFFQRHHTSWNFELLLKKMKALEAYKYSRRSEDCEEFEHAEKYCQDNDYYSVLGTLSKSEWEAVSIYQVFLFKKIDVNRGDKVEKKE